MLDLDLRLRHPAQVRVRVRVRVRMVPEPGEPAELRVLVERLEERRVHVDRHVHVHSHAHPVVEGRVALVLMLLMRLSAVGVDRRLGRALARGVCGVRGGAVARGACRRGGCGGVRLG